MNLCLNAFVIQFPDDLLDTCLVTAARALLLRFAHRGHRKDEDSYKECSSHVELSISLTRIRRKSSSNSGSGAASLSAVGRPAGCRWQGRVCSGRGCKSSWSKRPYVREA